MTPEQPRSYPLVLRTPSYAWWRPTIGIVLAILTMFLLAPMVASVVVAIVVAMHHQGSFDAAFRNALDLDPVTWQGLLYLNLALAFLVPGTWVLVRGLHGVAPGWLSSVLGRFRWRFFGICLGLSVVAIGAQLLVGAFLPGDPNDLGATPNHVDGTLVAMAVVVLLTTPFQAMGEEFLFRGYLMQAFGSLTRSPWFAIGLSAVLFALAHGVQNAPLFLDRLTFGLMAGYVVLRTGGLEAGIALHIWNNLVAFGLALFLGNIDETLKVSEVSWSNIWLTLVQNGVYLVLVLVAADRCGLTSRTERPVLPLASRPV